MPLDDHKTANVKEIPVKHFKSDFPTTLADLRRNLPSTFEHDTSTSQESIYKTLGRLRKSTLSIPNRLRSVLEDADFVQTLWAHLNESCPINLKSKSSLEVSSDGSNVTNGAGQTIWALIPNERSGSWPLDPALKLQSQHEYLSSTSSVPTATHDQSLPSKTTTETLPQPVSAYLKSTDGHINQWSFSLRRLNLPILSLLGHSRGAILIDTTRRGKTFPDALRRTAPIYTCVWNHILFPELVSTGVCDFQPRNIDASEAAQIRARVPRFVSELRGLGLDFAKIRNDTKRPTRCIWVAAPAGGKDDFDMTFESLVEDVKAEIQKWEHIKEVDGVNVLVCCSASRKVVGAEMSEDGYIQGSGDDSEGWSHGLTAKMFWDNKEQLMTAAELGGDMEELVKTIVQQSKTAGAPSSAVLVKPTTNLFLSSDKSLPAGYNLVIDCNSSVDVDTEPNEKQLCLSCKEGKIGSKMLRDKLAEVKQKVETLLQQDVDAKILVTCSTGKDLSVGVVLALLCTFYSETGSLQFSSSQTIDKQFIKQRLAWISTVKPDANPSRATLQAVNSFLMDRPA